MLNLFFQKITVVDVFLKYPKTSDYGMELSNLTFKFCYRMIMIIALQILVTMVPTVSTPKVTIIAIVQKCGKVKNVTFQDLWIMDATMDNAIIMVS